MTDDDAVVVLCTVPDRASGTAIADALVGEALAACVNEVPGITSTYRWQGEICRDSEYLLIIKTTRARFEPLRQRIRALHRYQTPEIIALPVLAGDADYLSWLGTSVASNPRQR